MKNKKIIEDIPVFSFIGNSVFFTIMILVVNFKLHKLLFSEVTKLNMSLFNINYFDLFYGKIGEFFYYVILFFFCILLFDILFFKSLSLIFKYESKYKFKGVLIYSFMILSFTTVFFNPISVVISLILITVLIKLKN